MATFNIPGTQITADVLLTSPGQRPNQRFDSAVVTLTDTNSQWDSTVGFIKMWGFQRSQDGVTFEWGPIIMGPPDLIPDHRFGYFYNGQWFCDTTLAAVAAAVLAAGGPVILDTVIKDFWYPFGRHPKDVATAMPYVGIFRAQVGDSNTRLRLAIMTTADIRLGATMVAT